MNKKHVYKAKNRTIENFMSAKKEMSILLNGKIR